MMMMMMMIMVLMTRREHICTINLRSAIWTAMHAQSIKASKSYHHHHHHHHHISAMELSHLLTRSGLMYPEVSSKVCHNSFRQLQNSVPLPWVIYYEAFYLHVVSSFSCIPVICPKLVSFLILL